MKRFFLSCLIISTCFVSVGQIDPLHSQYMFNPLILNPAYAGYHEMAMFVATQKYQWTGIDGSPRTSVFSGHTPLPLDKMGVGMNITRETYGVTRNIDASFIASYKLSFADKKLSMGLSGSYSSFNIGLDEIYRQNPDIPEDDLAPNAIISVSKPNFGFGAMYTTDKYFVGLSIPKILGVNGVIGENSVNMYLRHYYFSGGLILKIFNGTVFKPSFLFKTVENSPNNYDINGSLLIRENVWVGLSLRSSATSFKDALVPNSVVLMTQIQVNDYLKVGYSTDMPWEGDLYRAAEPIQLGGVLGRLAITHELMVNLNLAIFGNQAVQTIYF